MTIGVAPGDIGSGPREMNRCAVGAGAFDLPVHDEQGDVARDVGVPGIDPDRQAESEELGIRDHQRGSGHLTAGLRHEHRVGGVHLGERGRVAGVETSREHRGVLPRVGGQGEAGAVVRTDVGHTDSEHGPRVANQTVTDVQWDDELVPDDRGRTDAPEPDCPVEVSLTAIAGRWTTLVLRELMNGPLSFGDLRQRLPSLSAKVLTDRLRELEARELIERRAHRGFPVRTSYDLTARGRALRPLLIELYRTGITLTGLSNTNSNPI